MVQDIRVRSLSRYHISVVALLAAIFEGFYFAGFFDESHDWERGLFILLYSFLLIAIFSAALVVFILFYRTKNETLFIVAVAIFSWFIGAFFWVSYVFILENPVTYPSIAELAFQGFHMLMIPFLLYFVKSYDIKVIRPTWILIPLIVSLPVAYNAFSPVDLNIVVYSTFFLFLISITTVLTVNLMYKKRLILLGIALLIIAFADINFVIVHLQNPGAYVFMLDPLWISGFSLVSYAAIFHEGRGDLA